MFIPYPWKLMYNTTTRLVLQNIDSSHGLSPLLPPASMSASHKLLNPRTALSPGQGKAGAPRPLFSRQAEWNTANG